MESLVGLRIMKPCRWWNTSIVCCDQPATAEKETKDQRYLYAALRSLSDYAVKECYFDDSLTRKVSRYPEIIVGQIHKAEVSWRNPGTVTADNCN